MRAQWEVPRLRDRRAPVDAARVQAGGPAGPSGALLRVGSTNSNARPAWRRRARWLDAAALAIAAMACAAGDAHGEAVFWDDGIGDNDRWENFRNWNPDSVPTSTSDVTLGVFVETNRIDAEGYTYEAWSGRYQFEDPFLAVNSLTISTARPFTLDGYFLYISWEHPGSSGHTTLTLGSGDLTRHDVAGIEGDQNLDVNMRLASDAVWNVAGSGLLSVNSVAESGGARTFTKTGAGTLSTFLDVSGAKTISQGTFRGGFGGAGTASIASGAVFQLTSNSSSPVALNGLAGSVFFSSMQKSGTGAATLSGALSINNNPNISVDAGGSLELSGGITITARGGMGFLGPGELIISGPGNGSVATNVSGGQLTIAHSNALGNGSLYVQDVSGGSSIPIVAFADGVTFSNQLSLARGMVRGLGNSTVTYDTFLEGTVASTNILDVPQAIHTLALNGNIRETADISHSLTKTGAGTVVLGGANTYTGVTTVSAGTLVFNTSYTSGGGLDLADGATARLAAGGNTLLRTQAITIANGGKLETADNDLIVDYNGISPEVELRQFVIDGRINSAAGAGDTTLAIADNIEWGQAEFNGMEIDDTTVIGKYTYYGDANLDGMVTSDDYVSVDVGIGVGDSWVEGDFDMSGDVTSDDYVAIDVNLGKGTSNPLALAELKAELIALHTAMFGASYVEKLASAEANGFAALVPEPSCAGGLLLMSWQIARRRRGSVGATRT